MKFNKDLSWLKESEENEDLLSNDELDLVDEGLYVDPANYGNYDDLVDVVDKEGNPQKMTQHTYDANKNSGEFKDAPKKEEPKDDNEPEKSDNSSSSNFANSKEFNDLKDAIGTLRKPDSSSDASWNRDRAYIFSKAFPIFAEMEKQGKDPVEEYKQYKNNLPIKIEDVQAAEQEMFDIQSELTRARGLFGPNDEDTVKLQNKYNQARKKFDELDTGYDKQIPKNFSTAIDYYEKLKNGDDKFKRSFANWYKKNAQAYHDKYLDGSTAASLPPVAGMDAIEVEQSAKDKERSSIDNSNTLDKLKELAAKGDLEAIQKLLNK